MPTGSGITITALLEQRGLPGGEVWVCAMDGATVRPDAGLADGDVREHFASVAVG